MIIASGPLVFFGVREEPFYCFSPSMSKTPLVKQEKNKERYPTKDIALL
jgi:hypothetical protein